jgi:peroxin-19
MQMHSLVDSLMQSLLSKDVLYEPMREIGAMYPAWLAANRARLGRDELARYERQYSYIQQVRKEIA